MGEGEPQLRKKHQARDKHKHKNFLYTNKHIRLHESQRRDVVPTTKPCSKSN